MAGETPSVNVFLQPERKFDLKVAADLIPCPLETLRRWLKQYKDKFPARYRVVRREKPTRAWYRVRVLLSSEIIALSECALRGPGRTVHTFGQPTREGIFELYARRGVSPYAGSSQAGPPPGIGCAGTSGPDGHEDGPTPGRTA